MHSPNSPARLWGETRSLAALDPVRARGGGPILQDSSMWREGEGGLARPCTASESLESFVCATMQRRASHPRQKRQVELPTRSENRNEGSEVMLYALLMAGGSGTRFWPESRAKRPKQLLNIVDDSTMIQATVRRIASLIPYERIMVVCGLPHRQEISRQLPSIPEQMIVAEPKALNTAPCIALAACKLLRRDPEAIMAVLPSDHTIGNVARFLDLLRTAHTLAARGEALITFGIVPDRAETGYGYIECGELIEEADSQPVYRVNRFIEKPDLRRAMDYLERGNYLWNSGMFVWKASAIMEAFKTHLPRIAGAAEKILIAPDEYHEEEAVREAYEAMESVSIDYGILEKAENVVVIPADIQWNDVGSWNALEKMWENDPDGNAFKGKLLSLQSRDCIVSSQHKLTALVGVEDLIVVDTPDALMVCRKDRAQDVKILQGILKDQGHESLL